MSFLKETGDIIRGQREVEEAAARRQEELSRNREKWKKEYFDLIEKEAPALLSEWHRLGLSAIFEEVHKTAWPSYRFENGILRLGGRSVVIGLFNNEEWRCGDTWGYMSPHWEVGKRRLRDCLISAPAGYWPYEGDMQNLFVEGEIYHIEKETYSGPGSDGGTEWFYKVPLFNLRLIRNSVQLNVKGQDPYSIPVSTPDFKAVLETEVDSRIAKYLAARNT